MNLNEELMIYLRKNIPLHHHPLNLILLLNVFLLHRLYRIEFAILLLPDKDNLRVGTLADH